MALIDLLPPNYKNSREVIELQGAFEHWTEALNIAKDDLFLQLNVSTATWGLNMWEKALGIEIDVSKPLEYRRTRIMSKLRGAGTTTKEMIKNVSESYANGEVDVIENNPDYCFTIKFVGLKGIPPNLMILKKL
ncbi:putative phage tail protein [Ruminiclostridium josui]|uniref:putative phage tail protein n=1 Tax=Ruminiclostridium josui TaxID=1499 RepID=UPI000A9832F3|nr:putative phage tail protein [Ruminiclostridium josui]